MVLTGVLAAALLGEPADAAALRVKVRFPGWRGIRLREQFLDAPPPPYHSAAVKDAAVKPDVTPPVLSHGVGREYRCGEA